MVYNIIYILFSLALYVYMNDFIWEQRVGGSGGRRIFPPPLYILAPGEKSKRSDWMRRERVGFFPRPFTL